MAIAVPLGAGTSVLQLIEHVRRLCYGNTRPQLNKVETTMSVSAAAVNLAFQPRGIAVGSYLGIDDEILYVWQSDQTSRELQVERALLATEAAEHATGALVEVNPRFPQAEIRRTLIEEIGSWPTDMYQVKSVEVSAADRKHAEGIDLPITEDWFNILDVRRENEERSHYSNTWPRVNNWDLDHAANLTDFPSGVALLLKDGPSRSSAVRVTYAAPFNTSALATDSATAATIGLADSMVDIPVYGAAWRLLSGYESVRADMSAQGPPRVAEEVPPLHNMNTGAGFKRLRDMRLNEERARLMSLHPIRVM